MRYRTITVKTPQGERDVLAFKRALMRAAAPPVRTAYSQEREEISATMEYDCDPAYVKKCVDAMGLVIVEQGESES